MRSEGSAERSGPEAREVFGEPRLSSHPHPSPLAHPLPLPTREPGFKAEPREPTEAGPGRRWGDAGGAYPWWAAGSQAPGSRAL